MSNNVNTRLMERAGELSEIFTNHPSHLDTLLSQAITGGDLDELRRVVSIMEGTLAEEHFNRYEVY